MIIKQKFSDSRYYLELTKRETMSLTNEICDLVNDVPVEFRLERIKTLSDALHALRGALWNQDESIDYEHEHERYEQFDEQEYEARCSIR